MVDWIERYTVHPRSAAAICAAFEDTKVLIFPGTTEAVTLIPTARRFPLC